MFGKLTLKSIPTHEPIIMVTMAIVSLIIFFVLFLITYTKRWNWLWSEWLTSLDHKKIGVMYIIVSIVMLFRGFTDAILMRTQQTIASTNFLGGNGFLSSDHYNQIFTAHGVIMIFFMAMPLVIGLMNIIVPLQIGSRDVAFPRLNSISFWIFLSSVILMNLSFFIGEFAKTGWLAYPPLSEKNYSPDVGVDYWIWSLQIAGVSTTLNGINLITTILKMRAEGMSMMKIPVFTWTVLCSNILIVASFPILTSTIALLSMDRYLEAHFFTNDGGGNMMLYINLIWAWGHPEVYILILPAFGIFSEVTSTFCRKSIFGYQSLVLATVAITVMSFMVWLHHFFTMGSGAKVNSIFGIATMIIAIPTGVKMFNWLFTMFKGNISFRSPMLWTLGFIITFTVGGAAGVLLSIPSANFFLHNSLFLVAHFHNVIIGGVVFGCFSGITYWFPKVFGFLLNEKIGILSFSLWIIGFLLAFVPLYFLGLDGMTRRLSQHINPRYHLLLSVACFGTIIIAIGILCQIIQVIYSCLNKNMDVTGDPWNGRTLEWSIRSPAPVYNFAFLPKVKSRDDWWEIKKSRKRMQEMKKRRSKGYRSICLPNRSFSGILIGFSCLIFGFSMVWYIWWMAIFGMSLILVFSIHSFLTKEKMVYIDSKDVQRIEEPLKNVKNVYDIRRTDAF
ncbi:cytochrome o ubiquinol oxidase subunit I [Candidatus Riesia pediculicola]|uniref:cytochrome o ubiquinol oxidase subunit I n=1 Tax=Candidatus Riesia pediculicola TaxID=401619 RepID=UPI00178CF4AB|nr:cytochrome o ubiquinol oxidase subunit I [Candidatus Riesia pediculicola]QOJ86336.1 cytochrome o ubiquinol oxidase subunit I [Candidatus Riesia pediculicola]